MPMRRCAGPSCPHLVPEGTRYCPDHEAQYQAHRGTPRQRGYDTDYRKTRAAAARAIAAGNAVCWRCGQPIPPGTDWHLGHDDHDRSIIRGPEHAHCNLTAAGHASHEHATNRQAASRRDA